MLNIRRTLLGLKGVVGSFFTWKKSLTLIPLLYTIFFMENFYTLRISLFLTFNVIIRWISSNLLDEFSYLPLELPGLGLSFALIYFIPEVVINLYRWIIIFSGIKKEYHLIF
jgi:hypothetical protein